MAERRPDGGRGGFNLFNVLTAMVLAATFFLVLAIIALAVLSRGKLDLSPILGQAETVMLPTLQVAAIPPVLSSATPPVAGLEATWTPAPTERGAPAAPTNTRRPTAIPSITPTFPPPTPTRTPTPTPTETPSPTPTGPTPTATNTRSPFPFTKSIDSPIYLRNFANNAGCNWLGLAGETLDLAGNPVQPGSYQVHVWESGIDARVAVGAAPAYGPSGWEQFLFDSPVVRSYNVQLETLSGTAVSQVYQVQTLASCNDNLVYIVFEQNH